jgi:hypothetical protein
MNEKLFSCPLCGYRFDPQEHLTCGSCPLHKDCSMVCCPACGYSTVDVSQSKTAQWITSILNKDADREKA